MSLISEIIEALEPFAISNLIDLHKQSYFKQFGTEMDSRGLMLCRLHILSDLSKSIEKYTANGDKLISIGSSVSNKGNLEIVAMIERDGRVYRLETEVIYAGGYNIQRLHYRYITKTKLPKTGSTAVYNEYIAKIKKMTATEKIEQEINQYRGYAKEYQEQIDGCINLTDEQIKTKILAEREYHIGNIVWDELSDSAKINFGPTYAEFAAEQSRRIAEDVASYKHSNLVVANTRLKEMNKSIEKLINKLEVL
jgi:hypothetical protein